MLRDSPSLDPVCREGRSTQVPASPYALSPDCPMLLLQPLPLLLLRDIFPAELQEICLAEAATATAAARGTLPSRARRHKCSKWSFGIQFVGYQTNPDFVKSMRSTAHSNSSTGSGGRSRGRGV